MAVTWVRWEKEGCRILPVDCFEVHVIMYLFTKEKDSTCKINTVLFCKNIFNSKRELFFLKKSAEILFSIIFLDICFRKRTFVIHLSLHKKLEKLTLQACRIIICILLAGDRCVF